MKDVIIIGAGITGLATVHHLKKSNIDFTVLEQSDKIGGVINTVNEKGYIYEEGPNSGVIGNIEVIRLFEDLKDSCELELANDNVKKRWILKNRKWEQLPAGLMAAVKTPLFTLKDKFKILGEPFRKPGTNPHETLADLVKRRLGQSFLEYAIDPFILGVYAGDPSRLVPKYALPKLYNLEQDYGSFVGGTIKKMRIKKTEDDKKVTRAVFSAKGGLSALTTAILNHIGKENVVLSCDNIQVKPVDGHYAITYTSKLGNTIGTSSKVDGHYIVTYTNKEGIAVEVAAKKVISTIGAYNLAKIAPFVSEELVKKIDALHYTRVIEVVLGFDKWEGIELDAFGGLIPFKEKRDILGALFMSSLFSGRAPKGGVLFSIFLAGVRRPEIYTMNDEQVKEILKREVTELFHLKEYNPDLLKIIRHEWAIPQYEADSGERFTAVEEIEKQYPGFIVGGNLRNGIGMADRILQAKMLADAVI